MKKSIIFALMLTIAAQVLAAGDVYTYNYHPKLLNPAPIEGPWTFDEARNHAAFHVNNLDLSFNSVNNAAWAERDEFFWEAHVDHNLIYQWQDGDGVGFTLCAFCTSTSRCTVLSTYYHNEVVPPFTRYRLTWTYSLKVEADELPLSFALYQAESLVGIKDLLVCQDVHYWRGRNNVNNTLHYIEVGGIQKQKETEKYTNTFDFDNRNGETEQTKQRSLMAVLVVENPSFHPQDNHQWGGFKHYNSVWDAYYYKHITFNANGGFGTMKNQAIENSGKLTANAFTRAGYTFAGWATSEDGPVVYADGAQMTATLEDKGRVTLYAVWETTPGSAFDKISAIGDVVYTAECKANIDAAREAYDALSDEEKATVTNYSTLTDAEALYNAIDIVGFAINEIGEVSYTEESKELIDAARTAYDALNDELKPLVTNYSILTEAEARYAILEVEAKIAAIGTVTYTPECKALIDDARAAYNALTDGQRMQVTNYAVLLAAEAAYADLSKTALQFVGQDEAPVGDSERKSIEYPALPDGTTKWQTEQKNVSEDNTIVIQAQ